MTVEFPRRLLREKSHSWNLVGVAATPGQTALSVAPIIRTDGGGFWACSMTDISMSGKGKADIKALTLLWRAVRQICDGGVNAIIVPRNDALFRPWPTGVEQTAALSLPHSDGSFFDDGCGYYQAVIDITCAPAALRASSLDITLNYAGELQGGESFSIDHAVLGWRLYEISTVEMLSDTTATVQFSPPLREAVTNGTQLEFDRPRCTMRLAKTNSMDLAVSPWTFNSGSVDFVEVFQ